MRVGLNEAEHFLLLSVRLAVLQPWQVQMSSVRKFGRVFLKQSETGLSDNVVW